MLLASCGYDAKFHEWPTGEFYGQYNPQENNVKIKNVSWSKDGDVLVLTQAMGSANSVILSANPSLKVVGTIKINRVEAAAFSHLINNSLTLGLDNGNIMLYDVIGKTVSKVLKTVPASIDFLEYSPEDAYLAAGCSSGQIFLFNRNRRVCASFCVPNCYDISAMACHPTEEKYLGAASSTGNVALWDVNTGNCLLNTKSHKGAVTDIAFGYNNEIFSIVGVNKSFSLYSLKSKENIITHFTGNPLSSVDFNPEEINQMVISSTDGKILGYDLRNLTIPIRTIIPHANINKIKFQNKSNFHRLMELPYDDLGKESTTNSTAVSDGDNSTIDDFLMSNKKVEDKSIIIVGGGDSINKDSTKNDNLPKPDISNVPKTDNCYCDNTSDYSKIKNLLNDLINGSIKNVMDSMNNEFYKLKLQLSKEMINLENRLDEKFNEIIYVSESTSTIGIRKNMAKMDSDQESPIEIEILHK